MPRGIRIGTSHQGFELRRIVGVMRITDTQTTPETTPDDERFEQKKFHW